jgi:hypothetical protein
MVEISSKDLDFVERWAMRCTDIALAAPDRVAAATQIQPILLDFVAAYLQRQRRPQAQVSAPESDSRDRP